MDWKKILGSYDTQSKRTQASLAMFEMTNAGVGEPLAIEVVKQIYAKDTVVKGEREKLVTEAIAGVTKVERAVVMPDEVRTTGWKSTDVTNESGEKVGEIVSTDQELSQSDVNQIRKEWETLNHVIEGNIKRYIDDIKNSKPGDWEEVPTKIVDGLTVVADDPTHSPSIDVPEKKFNAE